MLEPKASRFFQAALQSGLIDEAGLAACFELIPPEKRTPDAIDRRLARQAISAGKLTLWQAQQILGGRSTGFKIDKYVLLDLLGRGGMGRVYLARDVRLNRLVALKILSQERMNNPRAIARFQREAKVGAQLQHENLVRVYDEGDSGGIRYLVMEYIEGKNVGQLIGELGSIPWPTAARLGRQIALGLEHARLKELIHRDVNPCNILVTQDGIAKLTDLGLAIDLNDQDNVTRDGATVGTFDYVSPEQARHSRSVDTRADIYSLGCTIYHMIAGRVPFPVASLPEKLYAHQLHDPDPLQELAPGVPEGLAEVVRKMMRKVPEERYQAPLEVAQALEPFAVESGWVATTVADHPAPAPGPSKSAPPASQAAPGQAGAGVVVEAPSSWVAGLNLDLGPEAAGSGGSGSGAVPTASGSGSGSGGVEPFLPLDLGVEQSFGEGLQLASRPRAKAKVKPSPPPPEPGPAPAPSPEGESAGAGAERAARIKVPTLKVPTLKVPTLKVPPRLALVGGGAVAAVAVIAVAATLATMAFSVPKAAENAIERKADVGKAKKPEIVHGDIVVVFGDGTSEAARTFNDALLMAATRAGAEVLLRAGTVRVDNSKAVRLGQGSVTVRAAEGIRPVLDVKLKGTQPMFLVNGNLRLEDLTVVVRYDSPSNAPTFQVERELVMERCGFRAIGAAEGSRLAVAEGRKATVSGCLFEGFETALEIEANPGMLVELKGSIFLSSRPGEEATGRAVRAHAIYGRGAGSRLTVEGCSARSATFLEVADFNPNTPLDVEVSGSAFLVKSLLAVEGDAKGPLGADSVVRWKGKDNRYQVAGPAWATFPGAPAGLDDWSKVAPESGSKVQPLKLAKEPPDPASPRTCALLDEEGKPVGADPAAVGPK